MHYFYVLYSLKDHKLYKGYSAQIANRFIKHQAGGTPSTKNRRPLVLIYVETFQSKQEALKREKWAKSLEGGAALTQLLKNKEILNNQRTLNFSSLNI